MPTFDNSSLLSRSLEWVQPRIFHQEYELLADGQRVGKLWFEGIFRMTATAEVEGQRWTLKHKGCFRHRVIATEPGWESPVAVMERGWSSAGVLQLTATGRRFRWKKGNFWGTEWAFLSDDEQVLVRFKFKGFFKKGVIVQVDPVAGQVTELPLLLVFGWYLMVLQMQQAAAAGA